MGGVAEENYAVDSQLLIRIQETMLMRLLDKVWFVWAYVCGVVRVQRCVLPSSLDSCCEGACCGGIGVLAGAWLQ